jgi:hypothetical protein
MQQKLKADMGILIKQKISDALQETASVRINFRTRPRSRPNLIVLLTNFCGVSIGYPLSQTYDATVDKKWQGQRGPRSRRG